MQTLYFFLLISLLLACTQAAKANEDFEFSGFARVVGGQINQDNAEFSGYGDSFSLSEQSLIALRGDYQLSDSLSVVGQVIAHTADSRDSGIQWLYADYRPNRFLSFKIGKHRTPFFQYSDVLDVGFAYPWITPPTVVYGDAFFNEFTGISGRYDFSGKHFSANVEAYRGSFEGNLEVRGTRLFADVTKTQGVIFSINMGNFSVRTAFHEGSVAIDFPEFSPLIETLEFLGFSASADALKIDHTPRFIQLGLAYETLDYFVRAEHTSTLSDAVLIPETIATYVTLGYSTHPYTYYITGSTSKATRNVPTNDIVQGISPEIDQLNAIFNNIIDQLPFDEADVFSLGVRYDINANIAIKGEISSIRGSENSRAYFNLIDPSETKQNAVLTQIALEWVF
jgi:hypothetical protein